MPPLTLHRLLVAVGQHNLCGLRADSDLRDKQITSHRYTFVHSESTVPLINIKAKDYHFQSFRIQIKLEIALQE